MIIIGVDPGKRAGLGILHTERKQSPEPWWSFAQLPAMEVLSEVHRWVKVFRLIESVYIHAERYAMGQKRISHQPDALRMLGALEWIAHQFNVPFVEQSRADRVKVTREQLIRINWWTPGGDDDNSAAQHTFIALVRRDPNHDLVKQAFGTI